VRWVRAVEERLLDGVPGGGHGAPAAGDYWPVEWAVGSFRRWARALACRVESESRGDGSLVLLALLSVGNVRLRPRRTAGHLFAF
jgi:hypothetical protein